MTTAVGQRNGLNYYESSTFWESPLDDGLSLVVAPWAEQNYDTPAGWRGEATVGLKRSMLQDGPWAIALQGGAFWASDPSPECREGGAETRIMAGRSWGETGFVNLEIARRSLAGGCDSVRIDLAAGFRPADNWLVAGEVFFDDRGDAASTKAQVSIARFGSDGRGVQVGFRARVDGGEAEPALVVALWGRPGD